MCCGPVRSPAGSKSAWAFAPDQQDRLPGGTQRAQMSHGSTQLEPSRPLAGSASASAVSREEPEFKDVFRDHAAYVLGLLRRLGVAEADLDDAAQEVFLVVHKALPGFEARSSVKTWVVGISLRVVAKYRRQLKRRREHATFAQHEPSADAGATHAVERAELRTRLQRALSQLPEDQRAVIVLFEVEEMAMSEIAQALQCSKFTAYTRLYAARRKLRVFLEQQELETSG